MTPQPFVGLHKIYKYLLYFQEAIKKDRFTAPGSLNYQGMAKGGIIFFILVLQEKLDN
jgi:hypothetical protein